jgi:hypothetical protein
VTIARGGDISKKSNATDDDGTIGYPETAGLQSDEKAFHSGIKMGMNPEDWVAEPTTFLLSCTMMRASASSS